MIYLVSCKKCRLQYIGSTTTDFRIRFRNHNSAMLTNKTTCEVAVHFNKTSHILDDFSFQCIDQVQAPNNSDEIDRLLITKEAYWSAQLFSLAPHGLNKRKDFILGIEFVIINFLFCDSLFAIYGRSKALFLDFVSLLGVGYTQRPCPGNLLQSLLFKGPPRDFVVYRPFGAPKASIWDFGMIHVCVNVGCFPFDCPFFCRFANVIFFELAVFSF